MTRFLFFIALFMAVNGAAQDCKKYVNVVTDAFGEKTPTAKNNIIVTDKNDVGFDITALTTQNTVVLVVGITGAVPCVATGDLIEVSFQDESTLTLINSYNDNCFGRSAAYLGPGQRNLSSLTQLSTKLITALKVWTKAASTTIAFNEQQAGALRETLKCLASYLKTRNYPGDSIPHYTQPIYKPDTARVVDVAEVPPEFEGGYKALMSFLARNMRYPAGAIPDGVSGIVYVSFIVNEDGLIQDPKILRPLHPALDAEALRVITVMPKWKPGTNKGTSVKARFTLPIKFSMVRKSD